MAATDKVGHLLDLPLEPIGGEPYTVPGETRGPELELQDVAWARPGWPLLFEGVSARVPRGGRLGIRGPSGAGKGVLLELLWGLRKPARGVIRLDGRDLRELSLESLRRAAALVEHLEVVEGSIRENVRLARDHVSAEDVREALRRVDLLDELVRLPDGIDTALGAHGQPLSRGEMARLQVARAIAGRPRLLMVSDLFLRLSGAHRRGVLDVLFDSDAPWTLVVVSNESDVLERCDQVLELSGRPHEAGVVAL
jgi:ABC-type multidrug transport system fused ATPase/permease subunit